MDVPTEQQPAVFVVDSELRVAIEMAGLEHACRRITC
jgi:hypothetical protein